MAKSKPKTTAKLKKELWTVFSRFIRLRDALRTTGNVYYLVCITCDKNYPTVDAQTGHFIPKKSSNYLRHDEKNNHGQCYACNCYRYGEQDLYAQAIERLYGKEELERLRRDRTKEKKDSRVEILELTELYKTKLNELIKTNGNPWK